MAINKFGSAKIEDIRKIESTYNMKLPDDYARFLLEYNGGIVSKEEDHQVYVNSLHDTIHVDVLYGICTGYENAEIDTWMSLFKDEILDGALIIGDSIEHGFIVLMCTGSDFGICYWDHAYVFAGSTDESNTYYIKNTFTGFITGLI